MLNEHLRGLAEVDEASLSFPHHTLKYLQNVKQMLFREDGRF